MYERAISQGLLALGRCKGGRRGWLWGHRRSAFFFLLCFPRIAPLSYHGVPRHCREVNGQECQSDVEDTERSYATLRMRLYSTGGGGAAAVPHGRVPPSLDLHPNTTLSSTRSTWFTQESTCNTRYSCSPSGGAAIRRRYLI